MTCWGTVQNSKRIKQVTRKKCIVPRKAIESVSFNYKKYTLCCNNTVLHETGAFSHTTKESQGATRKEGGLYHLSEELIIYQNVPPMLHKLCILSSARRQRGGWHVPDDPPRFLSSRESVPTSTCSQTGRTRSQGHGVHGCVPGLRQPLAEPLDPGITVEGSTKSEPPQNT